MASKKVISTPKAPLAIGAYSQAIVAQGPTVYVSGQIGWNPETNSFREDEGNVEVHPDAGKYIGQTKQAVQNMSNILEAAGSKIDNIVKATILVVGLNDTTYKLVNESYAEYFKNVEYPPARALIGVSALPKQSLVEIECIAILDN